jgi:hypothetical protein
MRSLSSIAAVTLILASSGFRPQAVGQTTCSSYNIGPVDVPTGTSGVNQHITGSHQFASVAAGQCLYPPTATYLQYCASVSTTTMYPGATDTGVLTTLVGYHVSAYSVTNGSQSNGSGASTSSGVDAAAWVYCLTPACNVNVSSSPISFPQPNVFTASQTGGQVCPQEPNPQYSSCGGDSNVPCGGGGCACQTEGCPPREICNADTCDCEYVSPIIVDTTGGGFKLTSPDDGVLFDMAGNGRLVQMAWTSAGSGNAFLALDRNHNGKIDNGKELFGNFTQQPPSPSRNGFSALAEFDKPENGGNGDGVIDQRDAVFPQLLLWIDANHDGVSQPEELHSLPDLGVYSISLHYRDDKHYEDQYGNWFHYQAALNPDPLDGTSKDGRLTYDVFFEVAGTKSQTTGSNAWNAVAAADHSLH